MIANILPTSVIHLDSHEWLPSGFKVPVAVNEFAFTDNSVEYGIVNDNGFWNTYKLLVDYTAAGAVSAITNGVIFNSGVFTVPVGVKNFLFTDNAVEYFAYCNGQTWHIIETDVDEGADYVVALWGDDANTGAYNQPFRTWQKAFDTAQAGNTIYFRGGVYYRQQEDSVPTINPISGVQESGTLGNVISYFGSPTDVANGDPVIYDFIMYTPPGEPPTQGYNSGISVNGLSSDPAERNSVGYIHFKDFTLRNVMQRRSMVSCIGLASLGCRDMTFERLIIHDIGGRGMYVDGYSGSGHTKFINVDTYNCFDILPYNLYTYERGINGHDGSGIVAAVTDTALTEPATMTLYGCRSWHNSKHGFAITSGANLITKNTWAFMIGLGYAENEVGYGIGYRMEVGASYVQDQPDQISHEAHNCIAALIKQSGFHEMTHFVANRNIYNNIAYKASQGYVIQASHSALPGAPRERKYTNNIGYQNTYIDMGNWDGSGSYTDTTNAWNNPLSIGVSDEDFVTMPTDDEMFAELRAPRKADGSLPDLTIFKLASASPLKGAGTNVGMSTTPDIGIDWDYLGTL